MRATLLLFALLLGCPAGGALLRPPAGAVPSLDDDDSADADDDDSTEEGPCPAGMALLPSGDVCIDRYEAALEVRQGEVWQPRTPFGPLGGAEVVRAVPAQGIPPQGYISGDEAAQACAAAGKRLCSSAEWLAACRGDEQRTWPYGDSYVPAACNDTYPGGHPVVDYFGSSDVWDPVSMNDPGINQQPDTLEPGGAHPACVTPEGVFDLHGNLHEWVSDSSGVFRGGFYADATINGAGCTYATTAHSTPYHDYSTGFRCCL